MTSVPTNNFLLPGDHPFPPSPHQHELQYSDGPTILDPSRSHDLQGFGLCGGSRVATYHVPQSALTHHGKLPVPRHFTRRRPRRQNIQGTIQQRPIHVSSYDSLPRVAILPPFNSRLNIDSNGPHSLFNHHPSPASIFPTSQFKPDAISQPSRIASFTAPQQPSLQPAFTFQLTPSTSNVAHAFPMRPYPSTPLADAPSSTVFHAGVQPSLSAAVAQGMAIPIPMTSELGPSSSSSLPFTRTNADPPTAGPSANGALVPLVRPLDHADAVLMDQPTHAEPEPGPTSVSHCPCCQRRDPLVRVDNTIEWVRRDVMKLTLLLNFSSNAEAEAHESWES